MRRPLSALLALFAALPLPAAAQPEAGRVRFEWTGGYLDTGALAEVDFTFDASGFGGLVVNRDEGTLDVDPALWYGAKGSYRWSPRLSFFASWMHSSAHYRATFPALASVDGVLDLEGYILATQDFAFGGNADERAESAMSTAISDLYMVGAAYEFRAMDGWVSPFVTLGAGMFTQRSDGRVIGLEFQRSVPEVYQTTTNLGQDPVSAFGLSAFSMDDTDPAVSLGAGLRVAISERWGVHAQFEDLVRLGVDLTYIDAASTPEPDINTGRLFSTTFRGTEGTIHNLALRVGLDYAVWPFNRPR